MRAREFLITENINTFDHLKSFLIGKIKDLPQDPQTQDLLDEIKDLLAEIPLVGKKNSLSTAFEKWSDTDVQQAKTLLATYVASLNASIQQKNAMVTRWRETGLINVNTLVDKTSHTIAEIVIDYNTNPAVKELADDLLTLQSQGRGKGEFMLAVLSPQIVSAGKEGGDIVINGRRVEVKTFTRGGFRFTDRNVRPGDEYRSQANLFLKTFARFLQSQPKTKKITTSTATQQQQTIPEPQVSTGPVPDRMHMNQLIALYRNLPTMFYREKFSSDLAQMIAQIFPKQNSSNILDAITSGNSILAHSLWTTAAFENYRTQKKDSDMLFIDQRGNTQFLYVGSAADVDSTAELAKAGYRLKPGTIYPVSKQEAYAYPQTELVKVG